MQKEIIIVTIIIIAIIIADVITQTYTKNNFAQINHQLDEIKGIGNEIENYEKNKDKNLINKDINNKKIELLEKIENMQNKWTEINKIAGLYIEHDELEKVNTSIAKFKSYFELEAYNEAIPELEDCKYILYHIQEKEDMQPINLF